jgi:hypothetical protein
MVEIINKVAKSALITINLQDWISKEEQISLDIKPWLEEGFLLKEKDFRQKLKSHDWENYKEKFVAIHCSSKAILPAWTYMLISIYLLPFAKKINKGSIKDLNMLLYKEVINQKDFSIYKDKKILIKGCSKEKIDENIYLLLIEKLLPFAHSIMYGEACSNVPLFKKKN